MIHRLTLLFTATFLLLIANGSNVFATVHSPQRHQTNANELEQQLEKAGDNRAQLEKALREIEPEFRNSMVFLVQHMPVRDLRSLSAELLLENVRLAHQARQSVPWGKSIPDEVFLNDVLPYANVDETREAWRKKLRTVCEPLIANCRTATEAAQALNQELFRQVNVKYSTARKRANQSPSESIDQGLASCTGLSILLTDACRSVGVPARLAGIPSWPNKRGNHTWVEIWDGEWHFTAAAEPNPNGLNRTWFQNDAALAIKDSRRHAIYAISYQKTKTTFPAVWSRDPENPIYAVNVTDRYAKDPKTSTPGLIHAMIRVWDADRRHRLVAQVLLDDKKKQKGQTRGDTADMNDMLSFAVPPNQQYQLQISHGDRKMTSTIKVTAEANQVFDITLGTEDAAPQNDSVKKPDEALLDFFSKPDAAAEFPKSLHDDYQKNPAQTRKVIWSAFLNSPMAQSSRNDFETNQVRFDKHLSPYTVKEVGKRPSNGWPLFIALHGGGGVPQKFNDSQWRHMQIYYRDQDSVEGYKYLALRAPNNTWNGFYDVYVYPLIENLIAQMVVHGDVDPNKVFVMGYSHGGYGAFAIGPKIPYRFAAVHASAAAPTGGETSAKTLRNTRFSFMVGENDTAYGRRERCENFAKQIDELKSKHPGDYPVTFLYQPGFGHGGLPDRDMIAQLYDAVRNPVPRKLTWELTDSVVDHFFWLSTSSPGKGQEIQCEIHGNQITVQQQNMEHVVLWLDERLIQPDRPISIVRGDQKQQVEYRPSLTTYCERLRAVQDPNLAFDFKIELKPEPNSR